MRTVMTQRPAISSSSVPWYVPGAVPAVAAAGRTLWASGIEGMWAAGVPVARSIGRPAGRSLSVTVQRWRKGDASGTHETWTVGGGGVLGEQATERAASNGRARLMRPEPYRGRRRAPAGRPGGQWGGHRRSSPRGGARAPAGKTGKG